MVTIIVVPSCPAFPYTGPFVFFQGISAVQDVAHVAGSSTVNRYIIVSSAVRVKRSMRCRLSLDPRYAVWLLKFVVATRRLFPPQCPPEPPSTGGCLKGGGGGRRSG